MLPLYCRLPHGKVKRRFDEVSKVVVRSWARQSSGFLDPHPEVWRHRLRLYAGACLVVRSWARQSSGLSDPHPEVWRHRLRFMLKHVLRVDVDDPLNPIDWFHGRLDSADDRLQCIGLV